MSRAIIIRFGQSGEVAGIEIIPPTEEAQKILEPTARLIWKALRPPLRVMLARRLVSLAEMILLRLKFTPRRSLWLDRLTLWAGK